MSTSEKGNEISHNQVNNEYDINKNIKNFEKSWSISEFVLNKQKYFLRFNTYREGSSKNNKTNLIHSLGAHSISDLPKYDLNVPSNDSLNMSLSSENNSFNLEDDIENGNISDDIIDEILEITLTNGEEVWFCKDYIEAVKSIGMEVDQHTELLKKALSEQDKEKKQFNYILEENGNDKLLKVLFVVEPSGDFVAATIPLKRLDAPKKGIMLIMQDFKMRHSALYENNEKLFQVGSTRQESMQLANLAVEEKNKLESLLYAQFARVLNEKKKKIRELENQVKQLRVENSEQKEIIASSTDSKLRPSPRYLSKPKEEINLELENSPTNGDMFTEGTSPENKTTKRPRIKASRSRTRSRSKNLTKPTKPLLSSSQDIFDTPPKSNIQNNKPKEKKTNRIQPEDLLDELDF